MEFGRQDKEFLRSEIAKRVARAVLLTKAYIQIHTPVDTGRLRSSIIAERKGPFNWIIGTAVPYAEFVENGTIYQDGVGMFSDGLEMFPKFLERELRR